MASNRSPSSRIKNINNPVDIGVRVEVLASVMENLTKTLYEPKLVYFSRYLMIRFELSVSHHTAKSPLNLTMVS